MKPEEQGLARFLAGEVAAGEFTHREHLRMAVLVLGRHEFTEAACLYARALRRIGARAGAPEAFNTTITLAFLSLIAARVAASGATDVDTLLRAHPELLDRRLLSRWYRPEQLTSPLARRTFLLPDPAP